MQLFTFYASLYQISFLYSVARMNQPQCVIHDSLVACISMHDGTSQGTKKSAVIFPCISDNVSSTVKSVIHFECSVQLVARMNQPRYVIRDSLVACNLLHDRTTQGTLFNPFPAFPISCNKLHATMHDRITHGMLFNPFGYLRFCVTGCMR